MENVVPLYVKANTPTMNLDVEAEVRRAVRAGDRVLYRATAYYSDINDELPSLVFIKAWGMKTSFRCFAVIRNAKNSPRTGCV
ncbi:hypothetical protein [Actinokineospora auranticolor]|uniref:hypothetical protein n=1 Tax=Actinokineospora auranticolor TaxID=155976 RepID=UPI001FE7A1B1|nr:hypothetical protein [Actinokineospora auranticolor]